MAQSQETPEYRTFREHYDSLYHAIQDPLSLANRLFSQGIIALTVQEQMGVSRLSRLEKNNVLLGAIEMQIHTNPSTLSMFLSILNEDPSVQSLGENMRGKQCMCDRKLEIYFLSITMELDVTPTPACMSAACWNVARISLLLCRKLFFYHTVYNSQFRCLYNGGK